MSHPNCDMPDCVGEQKQEVKAGRDPSNNLIEICEGCLNDGWKMHVDLLE